MILLFQSINGALSEDFTLTIAFGIIGFLLVSIAGIVGNYFVNTLKEIRNDIKQHDNRIDLVERDQITIKSSIGRNNEELANDIVAKLRAITPR